MVIVGKEDLWRITDEYDIPQIAFTSVLGVYGSSFLMKDARRDYGL